jgi:glycolate oxidase FAD binding subunit
MTVTVEAGIRSEDLQKLLAAERQRLPIDVAQAHRATLGGAIATNTSGPGRFGHGTFRDYVIGISAVDGQGRLFSAGGRVVKNVAGYDICKLLVGSLGTLAIITQVTLKLRPQPQTRRLLWMTFDALRNLDDALSRLLTSQTRPVAIEALNNKAGRQIRTEAKLALPAERPVLCLAFEGAERETAWQVETVEAELRSLQPREVARVGGDDVETLWSALTEYQAASDDPLTFQATLPPSKTVEFIDAATHAGVAVQAHAGPLRQRGGGAGVAPPAARRRGARRRGAGRAQLRQRLEAAHSRVRTRRPPLAADAAREGGPRSSRSAQSGTIWGTHGNRGSSSWSGCLGFMNNRAESARSIISMARSMASRPDGFF